MDTPPTFTENPEKLPELVSPNITKEDDQSEESPYSSESQGSDDTSQEDIKTPVSLTPKSPSNDSSVEEAMTRYYKLKGAYDKKYNNAKKKLTATGKGLSVSEIKKKLK